MKAALIVAAALALSGCASFGTQFENRASCSPDGTRLYFHSMYLRFGITGLVNAEDSAALCNR